METDVNVVDLCPDLRMVLDSGPGQAYLLRRGPEAVLIDTGIAGQGDAIAEALRDWAGSPQSPGIRQSRSCGLEQL
jgi:glyoxylase-like metal-dependent hydrolase (beta-lactamase superfamily II)